MLKEFNALHTNETWELVPYPDNIAPIDNKWVYRPKLKSYSSWTNIRLELLSKGMIKLRVLTLLKPFSLIVKTQTIRVFLTLALSIDWNL